MGFILGADSHNNKTLRDQKSVVRKHIFIVSIHYTWNITYIGKALLTHVIFLYFRSLSLSLTLIPSSCVCYTQWQPQVRHPVLPKICWCSGKSKTLGIQDREKPHEPSQQRSRETSKYYKPFHSNLLFIPHNNNSHSSSIRFLSLSSRSDLKFNPSKVVAYNTLTNTWAALPEPCIRPKPHPRPLVSTKVATF